MKIYPNPVKNILNVLVDTKNTIDYHIYTLSGKLIAQGSLNGNGKINVSQLARGMYFISLSDQERSETLKFMK